MTKNCQLVGVSPKNLKGHFPPKTTPLPGICGITVGNLRDSRSRKKISTGGKTMRLHKLSGAPKKIMKIHEVEVFNRDHEILVYYSNP